MTKAIDASPVVRVSAIFLVAALVVAPSEPERAGADDGTTSTLEWLKKCQNADGSWGAGPSAHGTRGMTAIACLAIQSSTQAESSRGDRSLGASVRAGADYLTDSRSKQPADQLIQGVLGGHAEEALVALFLSQFYGNHRSGLDRATELRVLRSLHRTSEFLTKSQSKDGTWGSDRLGGAMGTALGIIALRSLEDAGVTIRQESVDNAQAALEKLFNPGLGLFDGFYSTADGIQQVYASSAALRALPASSTIPLREVAKRSMRLIESDPHSKTFLAVRGEDYLAASFLSQALAMRKFEETSADLIRVRERLHAHRRPDGSWLGHGCITGSVFATSCALLSLNAKNGVLPLPERTSADGR